MNESMKTILGRRSIRQFKPEHISAEEMDYITQAGVYAPSSQNNQDSLIVVVRDKAVRDRLSELNALISGGSGDPFYGAPDLAIVFGDSNFPNWKQDGALSLGNMLNMAKAQGIGSCWVNRAMETFELAEGRAMARAWGIPDSFKGVGYCILGYPDCEDPKPAPRKPGRIVTVE